MPGGRRLSQLLPIAQGCLAILLFLIGSRCTRPAACPFRRNPQALVDSVSAHYRIDRRHYAATGQVIVPLGQGHGYFDLSLCVAGQDSSLLRVTRGEGEWIRIDRQTIRIKRLPGNPLVLQRSNVNHDPVEQRELYVLLPDVFSWLLPAYSVARVDRAGKTGCRATLLPQKVGSPVGRVELDVDSKTYQVREVRVYSRSGDLGGRIRYDDFSHTFGYWIPRSIAVDFVVGANSYDELYRLLRVRGFTSTGAPGPDATPSVSSTN
jgi:hypothetical protein